MADFQVLIGDFIDSYYNLTMKTFVVHRFASTRCQSAKWIIVHDDDAVIRWKLLVDKLRGNTVQYNFNCLYSPPVNEFPMRYGQNNVARKFKSLDEFRFRWLGNSVIEIGKAISISLMFNHLK